MQLDENCARRMSGRVYCHYRAEDNAEAEEKILFPALPSCMTHSADFPVPMQCLLNSEKDFEWKKEGIEESS